MTAPASRMAHRDGLTGRLQRTEVQRLPSSIPGRDIVQVLTQIPSQTESGWHTHPGEEVGYIIAGHVEMIVGDDPPLALAAGDGFTVPPDVAHNARDVGDHVGVMLSTYLVRTGEPVATLHPAPAKAR
ncbi:cupin domain-containing protein [Nocardioides astragali]|uniref:Cupin domain-containing protein n=1 Tax=Nocardioides astragali TaxID=1776736 RepID=A0ABW2N2K0_9ACTN|nr:cupin domain-containing protein [Nocardioides astragali]